MLIIHAKIHTMNEDKVIPDGFVRICGSRIGAVGGERLSRSRAGRFWMSAERICIPVL